MQSRLKLWAYELGQDCKWLVNHGIPMVNDLAKYMFKLVEVGYDNDRKDGFTEGKMFVIKKRPDHTFESHKTDC
ncbi:hypothetical protein Hanom_Chr11g01014101 [Helianthus anomalus]